MTDLIERKGEISGFQSITDLRVYALAQAHLIKAQQAEIARLREALVWYGEQTRLCRLTHSEGDEGRDNLSNDGGKRARAALEQKP